MLRRGRNGRHRYDLSVTPSAETEAYRWQALHASRSLSSWPAGFSKSKSVAAACTLAGFHIVPLQTVYSDLTGQLHSFKYFFLLQSHKPFLSNGVDMQYKLQKGKLFYFHEKFNFSPVSITG